MQKKMYTYEVRTEEMGAEFCDEIDVLAGSRAEADQLARAEADDLYGDDSTLTLVEAGGSGGFVQILKIV